MEHFLEQTRAFLTAVQMQMEPDSLIRTLEVTEKAYDAIGDVFGTHECNGIEAVYAAVLIQASVLEYMIAQLGELDAEPSTVQ